MISGRAKRVIVYTAALLLAPLPVMPYERATREFALALIACGVVLALSSFYVVVGETRLEARSLVGTKLLAAAIITLLFGLIMALGSMVYLMIR